MFNLQRTLENEFVKIIPLHPDDFEKLFAVACDPLIWEQHPNKDRFKREIFENFFKGAIESKGAFLVYDNKTNEIIGSSRFYDFSSETNSILIGYTFLAKDHWGSTFNPQLKILMLHYAFQFVETVFFHIGAENIRSQKAIEKLGAIKTRAIEVSYFGEPEKLNFEYQITKEMWLEKLSNDKNPAN